MDICIMFISLELGLVYCLLRPNPFMLPHVFIQLNPYFYDMGKQKSYSAAFTNPNWHNAMLDKYTAFIKNENWILVPCPLHTNILRSLWLFKHNYLADGYLSRTRLALLLTVTVYNLVLIVMRRLVWRLNRLQFVLCLV